MTQAIERRYVSSFELRCCMTGGKRQMSGYAATFNQPISRGMQRALGFSERIAPGAFKRAIRTKQDVICTQDHKSELLMGRVANGTLRLSEDRKGLAFTCDLPDTQPARDLHALIQRGDIRGCSFGFVVNGSNGEVWGKEKNDNGNLQATRTLVDVDLLDVSAVAMPAYDVGTEVNSREDKELDDDDDLEENSLQEVERSLWPNGVPAEVRSHRAVITRVLSQSDRRKMAMRVELAKRDL